MGCDRCAHDDGWRGDAGCHREESTAAIKATWDQTPRAGIILGTGLGGLVDEIELFVWPVVLGGRNPALPAGGSTARALGDEHRFGSGAVRLHYRVR